jgi:acyl-CoA thioesterase
VTGPHGGYLAAIIVRACLIKADSRRKLRSVTIHYLQPARAGAIEVECDAVRETRTATTVRLTMVQNGAPIVAALATILVGREGLEFSDAVMPDVPDPDATAEVTFEPGRGISDFAPAFSRQLEYRPCIGPEPLSGGEEAIAGGWMRLRDERPFDEPAAAVMVDAWWPSVSSRLRQLPRAPTMDLTIHFRQSLPAVTTPVLAMFRAKMAAEGLILEDGELWSSDGRLIVESRQLAVLVAPLEALEPAASSTAR